MPFPFTRISKSQFVSIKAKKAARKARRAVRVAENAVMQRLAQPVGAGGAEPSNLCSDTHKRATGKLGAKRKKNKVPARKRLIARLDAVFSMFIRLRGKKLTGGVCELCLKRPVECCFHWVSRGDYATRWSPDNAVASCRGCNFEETFRKRKYRDLHISRVGLESREALEAKARSFAKFTDADLTQILGDIRGKLEAA